MPKHDWNNPAALPPIRSYRPGEGLTLEMISNWRVFEGIVRPSGANAGKKRDRFNALFGAGNWRQGWMFESRVIDRPEAIALYEEAYYHFFLNNPDTLDWLCRTASEVYDNNVSNVESGLDYTVQEVKSAHLQDIAVRRVIVRSGRKLEGGHLVEIHDEGSEGFHINPGQVPFHRREQILQSAVRDWWEHDSIEAFWQHNKVILVRPDVLTEEIINQVRGY